MRKELFSQTEKVLKIWKNIGLHRFQKMLKLGDSLPGKCALGEKAKGVAFASALKGSNLQSIKAHRGLFKEIRHVLSHLSRSQRKMGLFRQDLWRSPLSNGLNPCDIRERPTRSLRMLYQQKLCQLKLNGTETGQNEGR